MAARSPSRCVGTRGIETYRRRTVGWSIRAFGLDWRQTGRASAARWSPWAPPIMAETTRLELYLFAHLLKKTMRHLSG